MKRAVSGQWIALLIALALLASGLGLAEDALVIEASDNASADGELFVVEEAPGDAGDEGVAELPEELGPVDLTEPQAVEPPEAEAPEAEASPADEGDAIEALRNANLEAIQLGEGEKHTLITDDFGLEGEFGASVSLYDLLAPAIKYGVRITFTSTASKVAKVSRKGVITGRKKGKATIVCYADGDFLVSIDVSVVSKPKKVSLSVSKTTIGVGETVRLVPRLPSGTHASFTWSTRNRKIATVSAGTVKGKKKGKTTVTVKTHNGKKATATVIVKGKPGSVKLNKTSLALQLDKNVTLKATLPSGTASRITWTSSDKNVATVTSGGKVKAVGCGTATITARTYNGKQATCTVTVSAPETTVAPDPVDSTVKYRALLIGQESFIPICRRNRGDVGLMTRMLKSVRGLYGGTFTITQKYNLSSADTLNAIRAAFADADGNDVSLFFIATHGDITSTGVYAGALAMLPSGDVLLMRDLANALKQVPGKVIVVLESCGAGAGIYDDRSDDARTSYEANARAFDQAAVKAFSAADPGIVVELQSGEMDANGLRTNTGELRVENKFYVLAASEYREASYGMESGSENSYNLFTNWLTSGVGTSGNMPADTNRNGQLTLKELYAYISNVGDYTPIFDGVSYCYQHVQVYPADSGFVLFTR